MRWSRSRGLPVFVCAVIALSATSMRSFGTTVQDLVRIKGHERNVLTGMGLVVGLNGTGDKSKASLVAARPYGKLLANLGNPVLSLEELIKADAYAIVQVSMEIPAMGVREGDRLDVHVATLFNAQSLAGGRLIVSPLRLPRPDSPDLEMLAFAEGPVIIEGGAIGNPRTGVVRSGGQMLRDVRTNPVSLGGVMTLVLKDQYAGYPVATTIASAINDEFVLDGYVDMAFVEDAKNVRIVVPEADRKSPAQFIATLLTVPIDPSLIQTEARIVINERAGIIAVTGNVQVGPVAITHKGLTITSITPEPVPTVDEPRVEVSRWAGLDTTDRLSRSSTRLVELLDAFKQLNVPVSDQIAVLYELRKTGALHAEIVTE